MTGSDIGVQHLPKRLGQKSDTAVPWRDVCCKNVPPLSGLVRHLEQYWCSHDGLTQQVLVLVLVHHVSTGTSQQPHRACCHFPPSR
jgi:hypothetical protein